MTKRILILSFLIFISLKSNGQSISDLSIKICDSIKSRQFKNSDTIALQQTEIYISFLSKYVQKQNNLKIENLNNDFNSINYKLTRELNKTCDNFKIKNSVILPLTNLIEIDSVFSTEQRKKINDLTKEIRTKNRMEILILSIDELNPNTDISEFAYNKLIDWNIGGVFQKSGTIIVFSKKLRKVAISTTEISMKYLTNKDCDKLIAEIMIPNFKNNNYYDGIYQSLIEIKSIIK
ncbi:TPM domain-containing protein [Flavobacterium hibernum]|uniref:TPM domain-containing protein n=1 Tax=Flavobacterium hibernum TaxID=37752 RepID=A0A0D0ELV7_9FLAO|nr:TPM domain-containing protein [Flavobacterium hibernum]KIO53215.1 hypothetical protein IW18_07840 [Flavobacterium hibernum]OXA87813.1 hypothetical protein B0A73_08450 [Flavobacterium hibernum]STO10395.1 Domain of uncharacterised function (DUF477) [Flavobacterium hibernum]